MAPPHILSVNVHRAQGASSKEDKVIACGFSYFAALSQLVAKGLDNNEIAEQLYVSVVTVKTHIKHILEKIGGTNRVHVAIAVLEQR
nr:helix-turn-helix transcriptional regulator [Corynebacterium striatum]